MGSTYLQNKKCSCRDWFRYRGYRSVLVLGNTPQVLLSSELKRNVVPISYFTGVTLKFWSYITKPFPPISKGLDAIATIMLSPLWLVESIYNGITGPFFEKSPLHVKIPLNVTGQVIAGSGLTWDRIGHICEFVKVMKKVGLSKKLKAAGKILKIIKTEREL
jgi:hypothetical protein